MEGDFCFQTNFIRIRIQDSWSEWDEQLVILVTGALTSNSLPQISILLLS